jgi:hypothetical protein
MFLSATGNTMVGADERIAFEEAITMRPSIFAEMRRSKLRIAIRVRMERKSQ